MTSPPDSATPRAIALSFLQHCFDGRAGSAAAMLTADATWWVLGDAEKLKVSGTRDRGQIERFLNKVLSGFQGGMQVEFTGTTAEGERVAIEAVSTAVLVNGTPYRNRYHFLLLIRDGKVASVREYMDTHYIYELQQAAAPPKPAS